MLLSQDTVDKYNALPKRWRSEILVKVRQVQKTKYNTRINLIMQRKEQPTPDERRTVIALVNQYYAEYFGNEVPPESNPSEDELKRTGGTLPLPLG
jgi:hypothetical protein